MTNKTFNRHMTAIADKRIERTNIIGMRKMINVSLRADYGLSNSPMATVVPISDIDSLYQAIYNNRPTVLGELHDSGVKLLQNRRYKNRWTSAQQFTIDRIAQFQLVDWFSVGRFHVTPVYRVIGFDGVPFDFHNLSWQSGGNGPTVVS
jgi:hypothetical protein